MRYGVIIRIQFLLFIGGCLHAQDTIVSKVELSEVTVSAAAQGHFAGRQAIRTTVVDVKPLETQPASLTELMNRSAGIRIRQTGGLGSETSIMLNGFGGKSIRYFKDGIPMDYLGEAFNFSIVPLTVIDRVEVYKGVLPVSLGADALGGAVNIVTRQLSTPPPTHRGGKRLTYPTNTARSTLTRPPSMPLYGTLPAGISQGWTLSTTVRTTTMG
jgi:outer membrane cobalamin receptor